MIKMRLNWYIKISGKKYPVCYEKMAEENGGGWECSVPELGRAAYCGWGSSPQRAYKHLCQVAKHLEEINIRGIKNA